MDSDSDVDLSWVELAAEADARPLKRSLTPSPQLGDREAKRSRHEAGPKVSDTLFEETRDEINFQAAPSSTELVEDTKLANRGLIRAAQLGVPSRSESEPTELKLPRIRLTSGYIARLERAANPTREAWDMESRSGTIPMEQRRSGQFDERDVVDLSASDDEDTLGNPVKDSDVTETKSIILIERNACDCYDCRTNPSTRLMRGRHSGITDHAGRLLLRKQDERPFAEPPSFDYETFEKEHVPSDKMIRDMFPDDPEGRTAYRDAQTENELLKMFSEWNIGMKDAENPCSARDCATCHFHLDLRAEIQIDLEVVEEEFNVIQAALNDLQVWQRTFLDMDGELSFARGELDAGRNIFQGPGGPEALAKYGHRLEPIPKDDLAVWELCHLGGKGKLESLAYSYYNKTLGHHGDLFTSEYFGGINAKEKYIAFFDTFRDRKLHEIKDRLWKGEDLFFGLDEAVSNAGNALFSFWGEWPGYSWSPKHDLETWERFHIGEACGGNAETKERLADGEDLFSSAYFGGVEARAKWAYLVMGPNKFDDVEIENQLQQGKDVFASLDWEYLECLKSWVVESIRLRYESLLEKLGRPPKHDLETWEWFHIDESRGGIEKTKERLADEEDLFSSVYFGGVEAREKWGYLVWDFYSLDDGGNICGDGEWLLREGIDIFVPDMCEAWESWAGESARVKHGHLLEKLGRPLKHDLETWEWFHIDESGGGIEKTKERLADGEDLFSSAYFGGVEARAKWAYLVVGPNKFDDVEIENQLQQGKDVFASLDWEYLECEESWVAESARLRYESLLEKLGRPPKHDLETWEWFHLDEDGIGTTKIERRLREGKCIFEGEFFGGVAARSKYGHLAPKTMKHF